MTDNKKSGLCKICASLLKETGQKFADGTAVYKCGKCGATQPA